MAYALGIQDDIGAYSFGNIGIPERLEFSVVLPVTNEVAGMESLTKESSQRVVTSGILARSSETNLSRWERIC